MPLAPGLILLLRIDALALLFVSLSAVLWLLTTIYAIAYFGTKPDLSRFFGFFSLCVAATTGLALSGSLISFFIFFELLTLATWPLVAHKQDEASLKAARSYLFYALPSGAAHCSGRSSGWKARPDPCSSPNGPTWMRLTR
jgi:multicomponent Na+:H+ antiporter subunit D